MSTYEHNMLVLKIWGIGSILSIICFILFAVLRNKKIKRYDIFIALTVGTLLTWIGPVVIGLCILIDNFENIVAFLDKDVIDLNKHISDRTITQQLKPINGKERKVLKYKISSTILSGKNNGHN